MITRPLLATMVGLVVGCAGPYAERPPATPAGPPSSEREAPGPATGEPGDADPPAADPPAAPADSTLVGHVTPDGRFHMEPDSAAAEAPAVERRTVVAGVVRSAARSPARAEAVPTDASPATPSPGAPATGYRVQIFAARDRATADGVAQRLESRLADQPVYVEQESSWYKVRVGDFATREEAEPLRIRLVEMGYAEAWTAQTTIATAR